jgi:putative hydrolase of the HAD superfamily
MRQPFQVVANEFSFSERLISDCLQLLSDLIYDEKMDPFEGYEILKNIPCKKYLVTTGFTKLQHSKIRQLNIDKDFETIFVIDPGKSKLTKKDIFQKILAEHQYKPQEVLVIGDDIHSEIKAAKELGMEAIVYNYNGEQTEVKGEQTISTFKELIPYLN